MVVGAVGSTLSLFCVRVLWSVLVLCSGLWAFPVLCCRLWSAMLSRFDVLAEIDV